MKPSSSSRRRFAGTLAAAIILAAAAFAVAKPAKPATPEKAPEVSAASLLGAEVKGDNWTVAPAVKSDGFVRIFALTTPYGDFQVNGRRRMQQRLQELRALHVLEGMSKSREFMNALANAGMAPIRFGRDLVLDPVETTGNVVSGIGKMFSNVAAGVSGKGGGRDSAMGSITGQTAAERELAFRLGVDPYTDFTPLRKGLDDVARAMTAGGLTVTAAIAVIPGGAGVAVSATSASADFAHSMASKTAADIAALVRAKLKALGVDAATIDAFVDNRSYSPADLFAIADALETLHAANSAAFVAAAAAAESADVAKFNRYRAELLAADSAQLGNLNAFLTAGDVAVTMNAKGHIVAAFPFDLVAWTGTVSASLARLTADVTAQNPHVQRFFATTGPVSARAAAELKKLGWTVVKL